MADAFTRDDAVVTGKTLAEARDELGKAEGIVVLTGAGVSAASGIPTFRDAGGLWEGEKVEDLATPGGFNRDPVRVWRWYQSRRNAIRECQPHDAHRAIARLTLARPDVTVVTQNVDGLHQEAIRQLAQRDSALPPVLELHGSILRDRCNLCSARDDGPSRQGANHTAHIEDRASLPRCARCGGLMRPAVVWFGETLPHEALDTAFERARQADVCIVAGTSAIVHPAASIPMATLETGGVIWEVNPSNTPLSRHAARTFRGDAGEVLSHLA